MSLNSQNPERVAVNALLTDSSVPNQINIVSESLDRLAAEVVTQTGTLKRHITVPVCVTTSAASLSRLSLTIFI